MNEMKQLIVVITCIPIGLFLVYTVTRIISLAVFKSFSETFGEVIWESEKEAPNIINRLTRAHHKESESDQ